MPTKTKRELEAELQELTERYEALQEQRGLEADRIASGEEVEPVAKEEEELFREDIEAFLGEASDNNSDLVVDGYRYDEEGAAHYVYRWPRKEFSLERVRGQFGGGKWNMRLKHRSGKLIRSRTIRIEGPRKEADPEPEEDPRSLIEKVFDRMDHLQEKLEEVRQGPPPGLVQPDPMNMALAMMQGFQSLLDPMREELREERARNRSSGDFDPERLVNIFEQGIRLGELASGPERDPMGSVLEQTLPGLLSFIGANREGAPTAPDSAALMRPNPPEDPVGDEKAKKYTGTRPGWDLILQPVLPRLYGWAKRKKDEALLAAFVIEELTPEVEAILLAQLKRGPEFLREFFLLHPEAEPYTDWLTDFWVAVADTYEWESPDLPMPHPFRPARHEDAIAEEDEEVDLTQPPPGAELH